MPRPRRTRPRDEAQPEVTAPAAAAAPLPAPPAAEPAQAPLLQRLVSRFWLPAALVALAALLRPNQVLVALTSPVVWLVVVVVAVLAVVFTRVGGRLGGPGVGRALGAVPAVAVLGFVLVPTLTGGEVDEALPGLPPAASAVGGQAAAPGTDPAAGEPPPAAGAAETGPVLLGEAAVEGIDHDAEGIARLVRLPDGQHVVRLEQFAVESGPDYRVWLVPGAGEEEPTDEGVELGALKGTSGNQNYEVPASAVPAPGEPVSVLVWCRAFSVPVALATVPLA